MTPRDHAILALLLSPFFLTLACLASVAIGYVCRRDNPRSNFRREYRRQMRNPYAPSPETRAARERLHAAAEEVDR